MRDFKHYNELSAMTDAIEYLRATITKPPYNYKWQIHDNSAYDIAQVIIKRHRDTDTSVTLAQVEVPKDANGDPIYESYYLHVSTRTTRIGAFLYQRMPERARVGLIMEYPEFVNEFGRAISGESDFEDLISIKRPFPQDVLAYSYTQPQKFVDFDKDAIQKELTSPTLLKNMAVYNKMKEGTPEATVEALEILKCPRVQMIKFKRMYGIHIDPNEISDEDIVGLI